MSDPEVSERLDCLAWKCSDPSDGDLITEASRRLSSGRSVRNHGFLYDLLDRVYVKIAEKECVVSGLSLTPDGQRRYYVAYLFEGRDSEGTWMTEEILLREGMRVTD